MAKHAQEIFFSHMDNTKGYWNDEFMQRKLKKILLPSAEPSSLRLPAYENSHDILADQFLEQADNKIPAKPFELVFSMSRKGNFYALKFLQSQLLAIEDADEDAIRRGRKLYSLLFPQMALSLKYAILVPGLLFPRLREVLRMNRKLGSPDSKVNYRRLMQTAHDVSLWMKDPSPIQPDDRWSNFKDSMNEKEMMDFLSLFRDAQDLLRSAADRAGFTGEGFESLMRVRLIHASVRLNLKLKNPAHYQLINDADMGQVLLGFSVGNLLSLLTYFRCPLSIQDCDSFIVLWYHISRYLGMNHCGNPLQQKSFVFGLTVLRDVLQTDIPNDERALEKYKTDGKNIHVMSDNIVNCVPTIAPDVAQNFLREMTKMDTKMFDQLKSPIHEVSLRSQLIVRPIIFVLMVWGFIAISLPILQPIFQYINRKLASVIFRVASRRAKTKWA